MERIVAVDDVEIWSRKAGAGDDAVLLLAGASMSSRIWSLGLEEALGAAGYSVISFDWRDTGRSTWRRFRDNPYTIEQLVDDAIAVADSWGEKRFSLVGYSMGGCVAQLLCLRRPDLVTSLGLVSSGCASTISIPDSERRRELWEAFRAQDDSSAEALILSLLHQWELFHGRGVEFDRDHWTEVIRDWVDWGYNPRCPHIKLGPQIFGEDRRGALEKLEVPTVLVHGGDDPMFPIDHAHELVSLLPDASLIEFAGAGHELFALPTAHRSLVDHLASTTRTLL